MKNRLLSVLLCCVLVCSTLVGCGNKEVAEPAMPSVSELADENATVESSTEETTEEVEVVDYSTAYDHYFDDWSMKNDNIEMTMKFRTDGVSESDSMLTIQKVGENVAFVGGTDDNCIGMYAIDNDLYFYFNVNSGMIAEEGGSDENGLYVLHTNGEKSESLDTDSVTSMTDEMTELDSENIISLSYLEEVIEDGVVYDTLSVKTKANADSETSTEATETSSDEMEYVVFINRETQELVKMTAYDETQKLGITVTFAEVDKVELPNLDVEAEEITEEEAVGMMMSVMFGSIMMAMPEDMLSGELSGGDITVEPAEGVTVVD